VSALLPAVVSAGPSPEPDVRLSPHPAPLLNISDHLSMCEFETVRLVSSSHLVHGLAMNEQADTTRIALEFRLSPS